MALIKTSLPRERGSSRSTSFGNIKFDENGVADVEEGVANALVKASPSLSLANETDQAPSKPETDKEPDSEPTSAVVQTTDTPPPAKVINEASDVDTDKSELDQVRESLDEKNIGEIRQILTDAGVKEEEFLKDEFKGKEGKPALIDFVIDKLYTE